MDLVQVSFHIMMLAVTPKRALWLKYLEANTSSKQGLCKIPFNGKMLFGKTLEGAFQRVTG